MTDLPPGFSDDFSSAPSNDNVGVFHGSGNVFDDLDVVLTRDEWAKACALFGVNLAYPFADVLPFPSPGDDILNELAEKKR